MNGFTFRAGRSRAPLSDPLRFLLLDEERREYHEHEYRDRAESQHYRDHDRQGDPGVTETAVHRDTRGVDEHEQPVLRGFPDLVESVAFRVIHTVDVVERARVGRQYHIRARADRAGHRVVIRLRVGDYPAHKAPLAARESRAERIVRGRVRRAESVKRSRRYR